MAAVVVCEANQDPDSCVKKWWDSDPKNSGGRLSFRLYPKKLEFPSCGQKNVSYYLHWSQASDTPKKNPKLPPEILDGASY
jgi:hypothetical protein